MKELSGLSYEPGAPSCGWVRENNVVHERMNHGIHIQAIINYLDNYEEDGGFQCVPGFRNHFNAWSDSLASNQVATRHALEAHSYSWNDKDPLHKLSIRIPIRAGCLLLWDQRTCHGTRPNNSSRPRIIQFFRVMLGETTISSIVLILSAACSSLINYRHLHGRQWMKND
jgi:ectoine hydroxylase-related dioxygenase (phytanoyl-CoA dioxygenase family)